MRTIFLVAALLVLTPGLALAQILEAEGRYWFPDLKSSAKIESDAIEGTRIDFEDDLGLDAEDMPEARLSLGVGSNRVRFAYTRASLQGDQTLQQDITFEGTTFNASTRVESDFEFHYGRVGWIWTPPLIPGLLRLGPMFEVKGFLADIELRAPAAGVRESATLPFVLPTVGLAAEVSPVSAVRLFAEISGLPAGDYGYLVDAEAGLRIVPIRFFTLSAGYRYFDVRAGDDEDFARLRLAGPFVGASFRF